MRKYKGSGLMESDNKGGIEWKISARSCSGKKIPSATAIGGAVWTRRGDDTLTAANSPEVNVLATELIDIGLWSELLLRTFGVGTYMSGRTNVRSRLQVPRRQVTGGGL